MDIETTGTQSRNKMKTEDWLIRSRRLLQAARLILLVLSLLLVSSPTLSAKKNQPVTLDFQDAPVSMVLQALADYQQLNLVVASGVSGNISLRLVDVPWEQALAIILRMGHLKVEHEGAVMMVFTEQDVQERQQRTTKTAEPDALINLTLALQHADAEQLVESLEEGNLLSPRGSVVVDKRTNTLLIRDTSASLTLLKGWLTEMDTPLQQVQLAAHIVTMSRENLQELGVRWGMGETPQAMPLRINNFNVNLPLPNSTVSAGFNVAHIGGRLLELELSTLEQENQIDIIASPRLMTSHQQTASIKQGSDIPYTVSRGENGASSIEFKEAVLGMEVTPKILHNGKITLNLKISQNMPGMKIKRGDTEALLIDKQEIKTQITVSNGETIVLGGIFQQKKTAKLLIKSPFWPIFLGWVRCLNKTPNNKTDENW